MKNDFVNAMNFVLSQSDAVHLTMSMTFPDLEKTRFGAGRDASARS